MHILLVTGESHIHSYICRYSKIIRGDSKHNESLIRLPKFQPLVANNSFVRISLLMYFGFRCSVMRCDNVILM